MSPLRHPDEEPDDPLVGEVPEKPEAVEVSTVLPWLAAAAAAVVVGSVIVFSPGSNPPTSTTPAVPSVPTTVPVLGETPPRTGEPTLDWRQAEGLDEVDWVNAVTAHDGDYYLAGEDEDSGSTIHSSRDGYAWEPVTDLPHPEGTVAQVTHLVSIDAALVAVGGVGDADGWTERAATWWADEDGSWRYRPLPEPEPPALAEDPRLPGDLETQLWVQGAAALVGEGVVVVGASEHALVNAGLERAEIPEEWEELLESGQASLINTGTEVRLEVHPFVVDTIELDSEAVPDPGIPFPERSLTWLVGPDSDPPPPPVEDLPYPAGVLEDGALYGSDRSGRLYTSDDGLTWDRVTALGGSDATPFAEGWVRSWERGLSYSTGGRDWTPITPDDLPDSISTMGLTAGPLGLLAMLFEFPPATEPNGPVTFETADGKVVEFTVQTGRARVLDGDGAVLIEFVPIGPDGNSSPVSRDGDDLVFSDPATGEELARVPIDDWAEENPRFTPSFPPVSLLHSRDGFEWSLLPVADLTDATGRPRGVHQTGDKAFLPLTSPEGIELWVGAEPGG